MKRSPSSNHPRRLLVERLEPRCLLSGTRTWDGGAGDGLWSSPANWSGNVLPAADDDVVFDGTSTQNVVIDMDVTVRSINATTAYTATIDNAPFDRNVTVGSSGVGGDGSVLLRNSAVNLGDGTWTVWGDWLHIDPATQTGPVMNSGASTVVLRGASNFVHGKAHLNALFNHLTIAAGAHLISPHKLGVRGTLLVAGTLEMQKLGDTTFMRSPDADVRILPGGRYTGGGGLRMEENTSISQQDGIIDCYTLTIEDSHNNDIVPGVYASARVFFFARQAGPNTFRPSAGTYTFTGENFYLRTDTDAPYTVNNSLNPNFIIYGNASIDPEGKSNASINWIRGAGTITLAGSGTKSIQFTQDALEHLVVDTPGGTRTLADAMTVRSVSVENGTFDLGGKNLTVSNAAGAPAAVTVAAGATLRSYGTGTLTLAGNVANDGTMILDGGGVGAGDSGEIFIRSTTTAPRDWSGSGAFYFTDVNVANQTSLSGTPNHVEVWSGTDAGGNLGWLFDPGDVDSDGDIDFQDFMALQAGYGIPGGATREEGDVDGDGDVDFQDYLLLESHFGYGLDMPTGDAVEQDAEIGSGGELIETDDTWMDTSYQAPRR